MASVGLLFKLKDLGDAVKKNLFIDDGLHLTQLAQQMNALSADHIIGKRIPFEGFDNNSPVGSVEIINPARVQKWVRNVIDGPSKSTTSAGPSGSSGSASTSGASSPSTSPSKTPAAIDSKCIN